MNAIEENAAIQREQAEVVPPERERTLATAKDVFHWPEWRALLLRLGCDPDIPLQTRCRLTLDVGQPVLIERSFWGTKARDD